MRDTGGGWPMRAGAPFDRAGTAGGWATRAGGPAGGGTWLPETCSLELWVTWRSTTPCSLQVPVWDTWAAVAGSSEATTTATIIHSTTKAIATGENREGQWN